MRSSRREFLKATGSSASLAALPRLNRSAFRFFSEDSLQAKLAADPLRPQFHLLPAKNWMNDPNGSIFWNGLYHMFYQYNPNAAVWGDMHWNHAVSEDMIHWRHLPVALAPTPGWDDADGCFTGSAVNDNGVAAILYTGVKTTSPDRATLRDGHHNFREVQCLAVSYDRQLRIWNKWKEPVLQPPNDPRLSGFRDPFLWQEEKTKTWYLGVASGQYKIGGRVLLYRSKNLINWEYLHPLATGAWTGKESVNPVDSGEMWECPDFFPLGKKHVLLYSTAGQVIWEVGELDPKELIFHAQKRGVLDHGAYYAQKTQLDSKGNRILWGWIPETRSESEYAAAGWAGCMALPRVLTLAEDGTLEMRFAREMESLHQVPATLKSGYLIAPDAPAVRIDGIKFENLTFELGWIAAKNPWSFTLSDSAGPWLSVGFSPENSGIRVTMNNASFVLAKANEKWNRFRMVVDGSVVETICNGQEALTVRIYTKPTGPLTLRTHVPEGSDFQWGEAWQLKPISKDRLTT